MKEIPVLYTKEENCCGCRACGNICPVNAISYEADDLGFFYPKIDAEKCIRCYRCVRVCDFQKADGVARQEPQKCFAAAHKDKKVLKASTSGGIFSALAEMVFERGGVVFGCVLDHDLIPKHVCAASREELFPMHGSKYVQSDTGEVYRQVQKVLAENKQVLFSGTPCQVAALYSFLGDRHVPGLLTVEVVCHGVPSVGMFHSYVKYLEKKHGIKIKDYKFRSKEKGWGVSDYFCDQRYTTNNILYKIVPAAAAAYIVNFRKNNLQRESCFSCKYSNFQRVSDFTMGDFHGFSGAGVKLKYVQGLSIFLVNSEKAMSYLPEIEKKLNLEAVSDIKKAIKINGNLWKPSEKGSEREKILAAYRSGRMDEYYEQFAHENRKTIRAAKVKRLVPTKFHVLWRKLKNTFKR